MLFLSAAFATLNYIALSIALTALCSSIVRSFRGSRTSTRFVHLAEDEGRRVDSNAVVENLVVDVVSHSGVVAAAEEASMCGDLLSLGNRRRNGDAVRFTVEDQHHVI